jgi:two-component system sensor histidine kinase DegS
MTTDISAPPFVLDVRVARSPLVGLRYGLDGRATDIDGVIARLEEAARDAGSQRADMHRRLQPYETARAAMLERIKPSNAAEVRTRLDEALELRTELSRLEERMDCVLQRIDGLRQQRSTFREVSRSVAGATELNGASIDAPGAAENQAVRQLFGLIGVDHDATALAILEGPMQLLADAALNTELVGRVIGRDPEGAAAGVARCRVGTDAALKSLLRVVLRIQPNGLHDAGPAVALRQLLADLPEGAGRLVVLGVARRLRPGVEVALYRIVQEAVGNAFEHGNAATVEVVLLFQPGRVVTVVRDDGEGFDLNATEARLGRGTGLGLITMRQRAGIEGGQLEVRSVVGEGTEVRASFPSPD